MTSDEFIDFIDNDHKKDMLHILHLDGFEDGYFVKLSNYDYVSCANWLNEKNIMWQSYGDFFAFNSENDAILFKITFK
jgi:hypothetical protein